MLQKQSQMQRILVWLCRTIAAPNTDAQPNRPFTQKEQRPSLPGQSPRLAHLGPGPQLPGSCIPCPCSFHSGELCLKAIMPPNAWISPVFQNIQISQPSPSPSRPQLSLPFFSMLFLFQSLCNDIPSETRD